LTSTSALRPPPDAGEFGGGFPSPPFCGLGLQLFIDAWPRSTIPDSEPDQLFTISPASSEIGPHA